MKLFAEAKQKTEEEEAPPAYSEDEILDDLQFFKGHVDLAGVPLIGAIANQVKDPEDFESTYRQHIALYVALPLLAGGVLATARMAVLSSPLASKGVLGMTT